MAFHSDSSMIHSSPAVPAAMSGGTVPFPEILLMKVSSQPARFPETESRQCLTPPEVLSEMVTLFRG